MQRSSRNGESIWGVFVVAAAMSQADVRWRDGSSSHVVWHLMMVVAVSLAEGLRHDFGFGPGQCLVSLTFPHLLSLVDQPSLIYVKSQYSLINYFSVKTNQSWILLLTEK